MVDKNDELLRAYSRIAAIVENVPNEGEGVVGVSTGNEYNNQVRRIAEALQLSLDEFLLDQNDLEEIDPRRQGATPHYSVSTFKKRSQGLMNYLVLLMPTETAAKVGRIGFRSSSDT